MRKFIEKLFIAAFCLYNTYTIDSTKNLAFYLLLCTIISLSLDLITSKKTRCFLYVLFLGFYFYNHMFIYYLPLIIYNLYLDFKDYSIFSVALVLNYLSPLIILQLFLSFYLSSTTNKFYIFLDENKIIRDELKEDTLYLKKYNEQLKIDKEKNIHIAVLTERNRIAREIHDSIGHTISSSILQVEALKTSNIMVDGLNLLQDTLNNGMNDIRNSIHNIYNESMDLKSSIEKLCKDIATMNIDIVYKFDDNLSYDLKFNILSVVKEALTNSVKHSNATELKVILLDQPKFYSIIIRDNGSIFTETDNLINKGIGLISMNEIASKYNGFVNYEFDNGFRIHMTLMKG